MGIIQETTVIIHTALNKLCGVSWCRKCCKKYGLTGNSHPAINVEMLRDQASFWILKQSKIKQTQGKEEGWKKNKKPKTKLKKKRNLGAKAC